MAAWVRTTHYCTNVAAGCKHALADRPFTDEEHRRHGGRCRDDAGEGCGAVLSLGDAVDLRPRLAGLLALGTLVIAAAGWGIRAVFFPPPLTDIAFASTQSETTDLAGTLMIEVVRPPGRAEAVSVEYTTVDGTALAGQDYSPVSGALRFESGEARKSVTVPLITDETFRKGPRDFRLVLLNVAGKPLHIVRVGPAQQARDEVALVEKAVRLASVVAKDVADLVVRQRMLDLALTASRQRAGEFAEYKELLGTVNGNLSRARETYVQNLRDLQGQPANAVLGAMDRAVTDLQQRGFDQQSRAAAVMRKHFTELLRQQRPDMDRWAQELSRVIPEAQLGPQASRSPTT